MMEEEEEHKQQAGDANTRIITNFPASTDYYLYEIRTEQ